MDNKKPINIVQIGYGYWGTNVARNIIQSRETNIIALSDAAQSRLTAAENVYGSAIPDYIVDYEKYLSDPNVDAFALVIQTDPSFEVAKRAARKGVNPQTKKAISIPAKKVVKFKAGKDLKDMVAKAK